MAKNEYPVLRSPVKDEQAQVANRGPSPEEVDEVAARKSRGLGGYSSTSPKSLGLPAGTLPSIPGILNTIPEQRGRKAPISESVFTDQGSFEALRDEAASFGVLNAAPSHRPMFKNVKHWSPPKKAAPYLDKIAEVEKLHDMPNNLIAAMAMQESGFNPKAKSSAGALGLMQIVPKYHPGVNTNDPDMSIEYGAEYLAKLKARFGSWELALAAYNWGPGNLRNHGIEQAPKETRDYVKKIMGRIHTKDAE